MKRKKTVIILVVICAVLFTVFVLGFLRAWSEEAREVQVNAVCQKLAIEIKGFQMQEGRYPHSLPELQSADYQGETEKQIIRELTDMIQHNNWHDTYEYIPSTNGFTIVVTGPEPAPSGWFGKQRKIEKHYELGQPIP
jgi:competence protein ComGC